MKICFYLDNSRRKEVDYSNPKRGNPGIGGTEFMIWTISYYLHELYDDLDIHILAPVINKLPKGINTHECFSTTQAVKLAKHISADILIIRGLTYKKEVYDLIDELKLKTLIWSHNFETHDSLKNVGNCNYVKRFITVSKEQYDRLRDHEVFLKACYIYNGIDLTNYPQYSSIENKENIVCYVGAISPIKGFEVLARCWSRIEVAVPNAQLYIIGGGNLYNNNTKLGRYGIAKEEYESSFVHYLTDHTGNIKRNIRLFGVLGNEEKLKVMSQAKIGVANIAKDETFCLTAVEFEAIKIPVVGKKGYGLLNTVSHRNTGILIESEKQFINSVIWLLKNEEVRGRLGSNGFRYVKENFDVFDICKHWYQLFYDVLNEKEPTINIRSSNYRYNHKWLRELNRRLKTNKLCNGLPALLEYPECIYSSAIYKKVRGN
ncbi:glycosyltransferase family 4 protein [Bacillus sp. AK128]